MSTTSPCFNMPGFRAAAAKKQSGSKRGSLPNSIPPNTELRGGEWIGSSKSSYATSVPGTFDALESLELFGMLRTYGDEEGGTQDNYLERNRALASQIWTRL